VVITGIGLVSALGLGTRETWAALLAGQSGVIRVTRFDITGYAAQIAAEVNGFDPLNWIEKKDIKKMDLFIQYAIAAAQFAMDDSKLAITAENAHLNLQTIHMSGKEVYKQAVTAMLAAARTAIEDAGLSVQDIACVIPHQANLRIIEAIGERLGIPREKVFVNVDRYGNTSAASVGIALDEANRSGRIKPGDYVLMVVFGGGLTWASTIIEW